MFPEYDELIHSEVADMANSAGQSGASAGAIFAAVFLREFIGEGNQWVHLDIAGPAWLPRESKKMAKWRNWSHGADFNRSRLSLLVYGLDKEALIIQLRNQLIIGL